MYIVFAVVVVMDEDCRGIPTSVMVGKMCSIFYLLECPRALH